MFWEESLRKINKCDLELFRNGSVHEFYRLKELITLEQVNTSVVEKTILINWSSVVNFYRMQMNLLMSLRFIFDDDGNDLPCSHHNVISLQSRPFLEYSCNYTSV